MEVAAAEEEGAVRDLAREDSVFAPPVGLRRLTKEESPAIR
jgi:hypothetical protein